MSAALSSEPDEPECSGLPGDAEEGTPQGLYVTLPAEELTLEGFAEGGRADTMAPGALLAMVLGAVAGDGGEGLAGMADDQLVGFLSGTRRMESHLAWARMAALAEFASRPRRQDFAADEVAAAFHLTWLSAAGGIGPGDAQRGSAGLDAAHRGPGPCPARRRGHWDLGGAESPRHPGPAARARLPAARGRAVRERRQSGRGGH